MASERNPLAEIDHNSSVFTVEQFLSLGAGLEPSDALTAASASKKRKALTPEPGPAIEEIDDDDPRLDDFQWSCGQVRAKIRRFIDSKEMKVSEFQNAINVSSKAYYDFMKQTGTMKGEFSSVYNNAHRFFTKRDLQGVKNKKNAPAKKKVNLENYDVSNIQLPGEGEVDVEVYDTCDEVRRKINAHFRNSGMTRAAFCREISKTFPETMDKRVNSNSLAQFLAKSGPNQGNASLVFYAGYVFFEKLRIRDGKPKTQFREKMEDVWGPEGGFDRKTPANASYICHVSSYIYVDEYGRVRSGRK